MHHIFISLATQWECDYLNISSVLRNYLDFTHSVEFDQKSIMRENNQTDFWTIWGLENPMGKNATLFSIPLSWGLNFARTRKKFFASLASLCMCVFEGILKCHLVQKSVIYSHGSRYCDEFQSKSRKISLVSYRTRKTSTIKIIPIVPFLSVLFIFGGKIKPNVANQREDFATEFPVSFL